MRNVYSILLAIAIAFPAMLPAQDRIVKKVPGTPVSIQTKQGSQSISTPPGRAVPARKKPQARMAAKPVSAGVKAAPVHYRRQAVNMDAGSHKTLQPMRQLFVYFPETPKMPQAKRMMAPDGFYPAITLSAQSDIDDFETNFPGCTSVGSLIIDGAITDISSLAAIASVDYLAVKNTSLTTLSALAALTTINDSLVIENNSSLSEMGLSGVSTLGGLALRNLPALTSVDGFSSDLTSIAHHVVISQVAATSLEGLASVSDIGGDLKILNSAVVAPGMTGLRTVGYIWFEGNENMTDLGLSFITKMNGMLINNLPQLTSLGTSEFGLSNGNIATLWLGNLPALTDISFAQQFTSVANLILINCSSLSDIDGFQNISHANYGIFIYNNSSLQNLNGLYQIYSVASDKIEISFNNNLSSLDGLQGIVETAGLWINHNASLGSISELSDQLIISNLNGDDLQITGNPQLSVCDVPAICNYLNSGNAVAPQIYGNADNCMDLSSVSGACGVTGECTATKEHVSWNGNVSSDWNDPQNWTPNKVPDACSIVTIPSGMPNDPSLEQDASIGGLIMNSSWLFLSDCNLTIKDEFSLYDAYIYDNYDYGYSHVKVLNAVAPKATFSSFIFAHGSLEIKNFTGEADFYNNVVYGDVIIMDHPARTDRVFTFGNEITGALTYINNSPAGNNYLSNGNSGADNIYGDLTIKNNSQNVLAVGIGLGEPLSVEGHVVIQEVYPGTVWLDKISFAGGNFQTFTVPEPVIGVGRMQAAGSSGLFEINNLFMRKYYESFLVLQQPLLVKEQLVLGEQPSAIISQHSAMLHLADDLVLTDEDTSNGSFIEGPVLKYGDDAFTFPLGKIEGVPMRTGSGELTEVTRRMSHNGYYKAPLSITAPSEPTAAFVAEYLRGNPHYNGYDTSAKVAGSGEILSKEYWMLHRHSGSSNVIAGLTYDQIHIGLPFTPAGLQIAGWNGSQWLNFGNGQITGESNRGLVQSADPLTTYGPLALSVSDVRKPIATIIAPTDTSVCRPATFKVHFTLDTLAAPGTEFTVEISDQEGHFGMYNTAIGGKTTSVSDSITVVIPGSVVPGMPYKIRLVGSPQGIVSANTPLVIPMIAPQTAVSIEGADSLCMGTGPLRYFITGKEAGIQYAWNITGADFEVIDDTAILNITNAGNLQIRVTPFNACGNGPVATKTVKVKPAAPGIAPSLSANGRWLYATAAPAGQNATAIVWYRNGVRIAGAGNLSYYASDGGSYQALYGNSCGEGPLSNAIDFAAAAMPQTITFDALPDRVYGDEPFALPAVSSAGLPVAYQLISGPGNITEGIFTITKSGTVTIKAYQQGDAVYDTAAPVTRSFVISKATQTIEWDTMPDYIFRKGIIYVSLPENSSGGIPIKYQSTATNIKISGRHVSIHGPGSVSITASQAGDTNYLPATPLTHTFCVRVAALDKIAGAQYVCPGQTAVYNTNKITGLSYHWRLSDGTAFPSTADTVEITWGATGNYKLLVSATGPCGTSSGIDTIDITVMDGVTAPVPVQNMLPHHGVTDQKLPLMLSWVPGHHTLSYDVFIWEEGTSKPVIPTAGNVAQISYELNSRSGLSYDKTYNWQVVSKNGCLQSAGPVQTFRLRKAADLTVTQVSAPLSANSGQKITITWKVKNMGEGNTMMNEKWADAVFLSFDTIPNFTMATTQNIAWSQLEFPVVPLLVGTRPNVSALDVGQEYTNSLDFDIPVHYSQPLYVYIIANFKGDALAPPDADYSNDTLRQKDPIQVVLTPTPDLRVDTVFLPATIFSGSTINVTYKVTNYGALTPAGSRWTDKLYISRSPLFSKKNALPLQRTKVNETYYPSIDATIANNAMLQTDSSVTRSMDVVIPNFISGTWFIHVVANDDQKLYEGALAENNESNKAIQILLTPTPQLTISSIHLPLTNVSTGQMVGVNWNVLNAGFYDNIEKNKGFYGRFLGMCGGSSGSGMSGSPESSLARSGGTQVKVTDVPKEFDSLSWGSSYWVDKVYLSTDANQLHTGTALYLGEVQKGIQNLGWRMPDDLIHMQTHCGATHGAVPYGTTANVLRPGSNHPSQFSFRMPKDLPDGAYYIYVQTNATNTVFMYADTPVVKRSAKITVSRPDLAAVNLSVPAAITGGSPFTIQYTVTNNGPGSIYNSSRTDAIYMSTSPVFDNHAELIKTTNFAEDVIPGTPVLHSVEHTLPDHTSGNRYFFVLTNADSAFAENNFSNNISAPASSVVSTALPADFIVVQVAASDTITVPGQTTISYTVKNNGVHPAIGEVVDSIYISCDPVYHPATAIGVSRKVMTRNLAAGSSITDTVQLRLIYPAYMVHSCFSKADYSKVYFFVKANATTSVYEAGDTTNNVAGSGERMFANRNLDLSVHNVSGPEEGIVGRPYALSWETTNIGLAPNATAWASQVWISSDSVNLDGAIGAAPMRNGILPAGQTKNNTSTVTIPKVPTGDYYIVVEEDPPALLENEVHRSNNRNLLRDESGRAKKVHIVQPLLSDLTGDIISAPEAVAVGQPMTITYKITNGGTGTTYPSKWDDRLWLAKSLKPSLLKGDTELRINKHTGNLEQGAFYEGSATVTIPMETAPGNYLLMVEADYRNNVIEANDTNNLAIRPILVYVPEPVELSVEQVTAPDTVYLGYTANSVRWHVRNNSSNRAKGISVDGIYISKNPVYDSSAVLIGLKNKNLDMPAASADTLSFAPVISNIPEGNYFILVRTDLLHSIHETDKTNNDGVTAKPVYVSVKELKLDETVTDSMSVPKYYKLHIPDSLMGATVLLTLKSEDSLTQRNEMYVGGGYIPSVIRSDYKFGTQNYGNQDILIADISEPLYYIAVQPVSKPAQKQNISLHAVKLPFAVLMAQTNRGGNGGNVTVKLSGSLFTDSMNARLSNGATVIHATRVYFVNSTVVYATFPLQGKPLGVYDVILTKTDLSEAVLHHGFSIVNPDNGGLYATGMNTGPNGPGTQPGCDPGAPAGLNSQLVTELVVPEKVFAGWPFVVQINYSNPTNMDIPVQTKVLYNDYNVPMAFSKESLQDGTASLHIEISESDGPPGVIRAGSSGSVTIYSTSPADAPAHHRIKFNLK